MLTGASDGRLSTFPVAPVSTGADKPHPQIQQPQRSCTAVICATTSTANTAVFDAITSTFIYPPTNFTTAATVATTSSTMVFTSYSCTKCVAFSGPVHMSPVSEISHQVRQNMSRFHMGDFISPYEMESTGSELMPNQNTAFHLGNRAGVFIWRIFVSPTYDLDSYRRDVGKRASSLSHMNAMLIFIVKLLGGEIIGR